MLVTLNSNSINSLSTFEPACSIHPYLKIPPHGLILTSRSLWVFQIKYCVGNNQLLKQVNVNMECIQRRKGLCKSLTPGRSRWLWLLHCEWAWLVSIWTVWENQGVWMKKVIQGPLWSMSWAICALLQQWSLVSLNLITQRSVILRGIWAPDTEDLQIT